MMALASPYGIAADHTSLETFEEGFQAGYTSRDDTCVLYHVGTYDRFPQREGRIKGCHVVTLIA